MKVCYNCDSHNVSLIPGKYYNTCENCGAWIVTFNQNANFAELYTEKYFTGEEYLNYELGKKIHKKNFLRKFKLLEKYLKLNEMKILEIGSATGEFLKTAKEKGVTSLIGIEISEFARKEAANHGFEVYSPLEENLDKIIKKFSPNLIVAWDVWEHLDSPSSILKHYLRLASPECFIALTTVDSGSKTAKHRGHSWRQFHPPTHINYPTQISFQKFCTNNRLNIMEHFYFGYYRPLAEYLAAIFGKKSWIVNSKLLFKIPLYLNLYDIQLIIAKKHPENEL